jgi:hypothetical protein
VTLSPEIKGLVEHWEVQPPLPAGLELHPSMGIIEGIPTEVCEKEKYVITASNSEGESTFTHEFDVKYPPPKDLNYPDAKDLYALGKNVHPSLSPTYDGYVETFNVAPELPKGLSMDEKTGVISGIAEAISPSTTYVVTAANAKDKTTKSITFRVELLPPADLRYPGIDDVYNVGETVGVDPEIDGGADKWVVEPALPVGMMLDEKTGRLHGVPTNTVEEKAYTVTASNSAGSTTAELTFMVTAPAPAGLAYPHTGETVSGTEVTWEPTIESGLCATYTIEPALPAGLDLDLATGTISGTPTVKSDKKTYEITATNISGSTTANFDIAVEEFRPRAKTQEEIKYDADTIQGFAASLEECTDIEYLCSEPGKKDSHTCWMLWMVHRAFLNDPTLTDFSFTGLAMPYPHEEPRIAPKLCKALASNTHIVNLELANSNMQRLQAFDMAESLRKNTTLKVLNVESNNLDPAGLTEMATALTDARETSGLEIWRLNNQKVFGTNLGRPFEAAAANLADKNTNIVKLGFSVQDPHWRDQITKSMLRNNDVLRRKRKKHKTAKLDAQAVEKPLRKLALDAVPDDNPAYEVFPPENEQLYICRKFMAEEKRIPGPTQLQAFAKKIGKTVTFSQASPTISDFTVKLLSAFNGVTVMAWDTREEKAEGALRGVTEKNKRWAIEVSPAAEVRYVYNTDKLPDISISQQVADWIRPAE